MSTLSWDVFVQTHLRPALSDVTGSQHDEDTLQSTVYAVIADLRSKGLDDIGPPVSTTTIPAVVQISYITPSNVSQNNIFYVTIGTTTISHTAGAGATPATVVNALVSAINASTSADFTDKTAVAAGAFLKLFADVAGVSFEVQTSSIRGAGTGNPSLTNVVNTPAAPAQTIPTAITQVEGDYADAFPLIATGVKYFLINDPVSKLATTSGLDITIDRQMVQQCRETYDLLTNAYISIYKSGANNIPAATFWKNYYARQSEERSASGSGGALTLSERLQLLQQEHQNRMAQLALEGDTALEVQQTRNDGTLDRQRLERQYELEDRLSRSRKASNGYLTAAGQFTITYLEDYTDATESTVQENVLLSLESLGLNSRLNANQVSTSNPIDVTPFNYIRIDIIANVPLRVAFYYLDPSLSAFQLIEPEITDDVIARRYSLAASTSFRVMVTGLTNNTRYIVNGELSV